MKIFTMMAYMGRINNEQSSIDGHKPSMCHYRGKPIYMVNHNVKHKEVIMEEFMFFCLGMGVAMSMFLAMFGVVYGINKLMGEDYDL